MANTPKKRCKPHNMKVRMERACRSLLATNHVCVVNIDPSGRQWMFNWKAARVIRSKQIADAFCDVPHRWTVYISVMCQDRTGVQYIKSVEIAPQGLYLVEHLTDVIEATYTDLLGECNPNHRIASGWIAIPNTVSLDEAQAAKVFAAAGAWHQVNAA